MRKRIYLAGPLTKGDLAHNVNQATEAFVKLAKAGFAPFCPQWSVYAKPAVSVDQGCGRASVWCEGTVNGTPEMSHDDWIDVDLPWVVASDALLRLPGESVGADLEEECAESRGIPVFYCVETLIAKLGVQQ